MLCEKIRNWLFSRIRVKIVVVGEKHVLVHKISNDAGYDLVSENKHIIRPGECEEVSCGIRVQMPSSIYAEIKARSSTTRMGFVVLPGIIDPGFRGPLFVTVHNISQKVGVIEEGERIGQLLFHPRVSIDLKVVDELDTSERDTDGFGSTGRF